MLTITYYIALSAILFTIGALGVLIRRNAILIFMETASVQFSEDGIFKTKNESLSTKKMGG